MQEHSGYVEENPRLLIWIIKPFERNLKKSFNISFQIWKKIQWHMLCAVLLLYLILRRLIIDNYTNTHLLFIWRCHVTLNTQNPPHRPHSTQKTLTQTKKILNSFGLSLNSLGSCDGWLNATSDCILCTYIQKLKSLSVCLPYDPPPPSPTVKQYQWLNTTTSLSTNQFWANQNRHSLIPLEYIYIITPPT